MLSSDHCSFKTKYMKALPSFKAQEVQLHYLRPLTIELTKITSAKDASIVFHEYIDENRIDFKEFFLVMTLSKSNDILSISQIGEGNTGCVAVNNKEIFLLAMKTNASSVIICHNHPSGNLSPSASDIKLTLQLKLLAKILHIQILDHIIITKEGYTSLEDEGHLESSLI